MEDAAYVLDQYLQDCHNLPAEIQHIYEELKNKELKYHELRKRIHHRDAQLHKFVRQHGSLQEAPKEAVYVPKIQADFARAMKYQDEKCQLAEKGLDLIERHLKRLDADMKRLQNEGLLVMDVPGRDASTAAVPVSAIGPRGGTPRPVKRQKQMERIISSSAPSSDNEEDEAADTQLYCFCQQVSYGDMVACDDANCRYEWFHYGCVGLKAPPSGRWYCSECSMRRRQQHA